MYVAKFLFFLLKQPKYLLYAVFIYGIGPGAWANGSEAGIIAAMIAIDIVSDIVCPWCFIGTRRWQAAVDRVRREFPDFRYRLRWLPFFLNPDTPMAGVPYMPFLEKKFGDRSEVEASFERIRAAGRPYGLDFAFEKIQLRANTLHAHRLIHWAQARGDVAALIERLFSAQFQRGEFVGDLRLLATIAGESGFDAVAASAYLESDAGTDEVRALEKSLRERGVRQVPTYIVEQRRIIVGAEDPEIFADCLHQELRA